MTALGVCQQGKCVIHPPDGQAITTFIRVTGKIDSRLMFYEKSGPEPVFDPGVRPRCEYAWWVATRPRGVRLRNPCCSRNGSMTSSMVSFSSPIAAARVSWSTGPPLN